MKGWRWGRCRWEERCDTRGDGTGCAGSVVQRSGWSLGRRGAVGGNDEEWKEHVGGEGGDGEYQERKCANPRGVFPGFVDFGWGEVRM